MGIEHLHGLLISIFSNTLSAFAGGGGSLVLMSGLILLLPTTSYLAILTLTKTSAAILTASSGYLHSNKQTLDWGMVFTLLISGTLGVALATYLVQYKIDEGLLIDFLPFLLFGVAIYLSFDKKMGTGEARKKAFTHLEYIEAALFSFVLSVANGMIAGMGPLFVAYFVIRFKASFIQTIAYLMISGMIINILQASYLLWTVDVDLILLAVVIAGSFGGAILGTKLQYKMGNKLVKPIALLMMTSMGLMMIFT